jgi:hypothetical protein
MNITLSLNVFGWRIGAFDIRVDQDPSAVVAGQPALDGYVKRISRRWVKHMAS